MNRLTILASIIRDMKYLQPKNIIKEKERFLTIKNYQPIFEYEELDFPTKEFKTQLKNIIKRTKEEEKDERIRKLTIESAEELTKIIEMLEARGTKEFTKKSLEIHEKPTKKIIKEAKKILKEKKNKKKEKKEISIEKVEQELTKEIKKISEEWSITRDENSLSRIRISPWKKTITLNPDSRFTNKGLKKIIVHEIRTHAARYENGSKQKYEVFTSGTKNYLETEEGLAKYNEEKAKVNEDMTRIAALALATELALKKSFREVYQELRKHFNEHTAFNITARVKRGLKDTSHPGAYTKDHLYLTGYYKIKELKPEEIKLLMTGKISQEYLPIIKELAEEKKIIIP